MSEMPKAYDPSAIEARWAEFWVQEKLFHVSTGEVASGQGQRVFTLLLPPPNVTGFLHMGHMLEHTESDITVRWHRMRGDNTLWQPGTDHAGIATQIVVERQLDLAATGVYSIAVIVAELLWFVSGSLTQAAYSRIGTADRARAASTALRVVHLGVAVLLVAAPLLWLAASWLVPTVLGAAYADSLLPLAVLFDLLGAFLKRDSLKAAGFWSLMAGVLGTGAAIVSGLVAEDATPHGAEAHAIMETHETLAFIVLGLFAILAIWRLVRRGVRIALNQLSRGKAANLNDALEISSGDIVVFTDARQLIERGALRRLVSNFADPDVGCVSGELMLGDPNGTESAKGMGLYWRIEKKIREWEGASGSVVGATGAFYGIRRHLFVNLPQETILDDVFTPMQVARQGQRVIFEPEARAWDVPDLGGSREFARKVRTLGGNYQLVQIAPWLLTSANPIRFEFISHKLLRLFVPFALAVLLISSLLIQGTFYRGMLIAQLAFYGLSVLAMAHLKMGPLNRASDAALTFVLLNTAAMVAFVRFISGRKVVWAR